MLLEIVSKGGNLALNVGPQPDGRLPEGAIKRIKELGAWLEQYGEGIYGTRMCEPFFTGEWAFTSKGDNVYAFRLYRDEKEPVTAELVIPYVREAVGAEELGTNRRLALERCDEGIKVRLPDGFAAGAGEAPIAHAIRILTR